MHVILQGTPYLGTYQFVRSLNDGSCMRNGSAAVEALGRRRQFDLAHAR
jgi:hypothetical protein